METLEREGLPSINLTLTGTVEEAVEKVKAAFKEEGFGNLTTINVQTTLKEKIGVETEPYVILGMCNPNLAHLALEAHPEIGLLLPCNVVVRKQGDEVLVSAQDPSVLVSFTGFSDLEPIAVEAKEKIAKAIRSIG